MRRSACDEIRAISSSYKWFQSKTLHVVLPRPAPTHFLIVQAALYSYILASYKTYNLNFMHTLLINNRPLSIYESGRIHPHGHAARWDKLGRTEHTNTEPCGLFNLCMLHGVGLGVRGTRAARRSWKWPGPRQWPAC